jgi:hypothetical protein
MRPTCCGLESVWVENVPGKGYNFCRECRNEVVDILEQVSKSSKAFDNLFWYSGFSKPIQLDDSFNIFSDKKLFKYVNLAIKESEEMLMTKEKERLPATDGGEKGRKIWEEGRKKKPSSTLIKIIEDSQDSENSEDVFNILLDEENNENSSN